MNKVIVAILATFLVAGGATATAANVFTSKDIKDKSIQNRDLREGAFTWSKLRKSTQDKIIRLAAQRNTAASQSPGVQGQAGPQGPKGDTGDDGATGSQGSAGSDANLPSAGNWGVVNRNTIGSPDQQLRSGPFDPPNGDGALNLTVRGAPETSNGSPPPDRREKAAWGNEQDFTGEALADVNAVGFWVFTTGENANRGNPNMPNIQFEVDRNGTGTGGPPGYSTLTYMPPQSTSNQWSDYIDGTITPGDPSGTGWWFSGSGNDCTLADPCTLAEAKADHPDADILSVMVSKGRDFSWQGAIDALRLNSTVYDFEEHGVSEVPAT